MKTLSVGFVIVCPTGVLLGHTTGAEHWDIPKGGLDDNEEPLMGACRELTEETGLTYDLVAQTLTCKFSAAVYDVSKFRDLGRHEYTKRKDLQLYELRVEQVIDVNTLKCESMVDRGTYQFPELDKFVISQSVHKHVTPAMYAWLKAHM